MEQIQWGIIGCGDVTEVKSGPAFNKAPNSKLVAVMRRNAEKAKDYAMRHGVPKWYSDANELINDPEVTAIYVATPPLQHEEYALAALKAGKQVYIEKPMAVNAAAAKRIQEAVAATKVQVSVAHYRREQPIFKKIKELIDSRIIGDIRMINLQLFQPDKSAMIAKTEENWRVNPEVSGGGLFYDLAPHQLDLMLYFFNAPKIIKGISLNQAGYYKADDITSGSILFENGALFTGTWCFSVPEEETKDYCEVIGSQGKISFSIFEHNPVLLNRMGETEEFSFDKLVHVQHPMIEKVVQYFLGYSPNPCSAEDGVTVMQMIDDFAKH